MRYLFLCIRKYFDCCSHHFIINKYFETIICGQKFFVDGIARLNYEQIFHTVFSFYSELQHFWALRLCNLVPVFAFFSFQSTVLLGRGSSCLEMRQGRSCIPVVVRRLITANLGWDRRKIVDGFNLALGLHF